MVSVRPRVIPEVAVPAAHRNLGNDDAETAFEAGGHQGIDTPIRLTINEIIKVAGLALMPPLIENPAALKVFREEISQFPIGRLAKFSFLDVAAHDDVVPEGLFVALFHGLHEVLCGLQRRAIDEVIVVPQGRRTGDEHADEEQNREANGEFHRMIARARSRVSRIFLSYSAKPERPIIANVSFFPYSTPG